MDTIIDLWIIASGLEYDGLEYHLKPDWGFTIKRDAKHQKYIFFDTFRGPGSDIYRLEVKVIDTKTFGEKYYLISPIKEITDILIKVKELPLENVKCVLFQFMNDDVKKETKIAKLLESYYKQYNIRLFCCSANSIFCSTILDIAEEFGVEDSQSLVFIRGDQVRCITIKRENDNFSISADNCFNAIFFFEFMDLAILEKQRCSFYFKPFNDYLLESEYLMKNRNRKFTTFQFFKSLVSNSIMFQIPDFSDWENKIEKEEDIPETKETSINKMMMVVSDIVTIKDTENLLTNVENSDNELIEWKLNDDISALIFESDPFVL
uniref:Uncharacterized protein n=1 Tax=Panagrolaimus davidi TaxID=227884 RepID=A0A914PD35_9BILA